MTPVKIFSAFLLFLIISVSFFTIKATASSSTLAETINSIVNIVDWTDANPFTSIWGIILANQNMTNFDEAIRQNIAKGDYINALYITRLAELNEYNSTTISEKTRTALQQISMCGSLPINSNASIYGDPNELNQGCFLVYNRFLIWAYNYADEHGLTSKWDKNQAFADFASLFDKPPTGSASGEMLWCDPQENWAKSYSSRYYDEHAETLSVFLKFYEIGVQEALAYADKAWTGIQSHWNGQYYGYTGKSTVECEMGNFAKVIGEYRQEKSNNISNWERVIQDLNYKLMSNNWSSPGWAVPGVVVHSESNRQLRLWETLSAIEALHQFFPNFNSSMKTNFASLLMGQTNAWEGLIESNLNDEGYFSGVYPGSQPSNTATACAAAILFLEGIVPVTGNIAIPLREENYPLDATPFFAREFNFDFQNQKIRIPVNAGELTFIYGSLPVSYNFTADGVYEIKFTSDWTEIESVTTTPSRPQDFEAVEGNASVLLTWSRPLSNGNAEVTSYNIYKGNATSEEELFKEVGNVLSYVDRDVSYGETYYYRIAAVNSIGESEPSKETKATFSGPTTTDTYDGLWHNSDFSIYLNATDPSGVDDIYYRINGGLVQNVSIDGQPHFTFESDANTLEYWSIDGVKNEELPHKMLTQIKLDKTSPTGSIQINNGKDSTSSTSVTLTLTATDATSRVYKVRFSNDGFWNTNPWEMYSSSKTWILTSGGGVKIVYYQIMDNAGLISLTYSDTITLTSSLSDSGNSRITPSATPSPSPSPTPSSTSTESPSLQPTESPTLPPSDEPALPLIALVFGPVLAAVGVCAFLLKKRR